MNRPSYNREADSRQKVISLGCDGPLSPAYSIIPQTTEV